MGHGLGLVEVSEAVELVVLVWVMGGLASGLIGVMVLMLVEVVV